MNFEFLHISFLKRQLERVQCMTPLHERPCVHPPITEASSYQAWWSPCPQASLIEEIQYIFFNSPKKDESTGICALCRHDVCKISQKKKKKKREESTRMLLWVGECARATRPARCGLLCEQQQLVRRTQCSQLWARPCDLFVGHAPPPPPPVLASRATLTQ